MTTSGLPEKLLRLIQSSIPTFAAAELLLFFSQYPDKQWQPEEIVIEIQPKAITVSAVKEYLALFKAGGLVSEKPEAGFQYDPTSPELETAVSALAQAYNERPVTLIRTIYTIADSKIQSFADSFKLKQD